MMEEHVSLPSARAAMGFSGLFVSVLLVGGLLSYLIGRLVESTGLSGTDRLLGGVFGAARGLALVVGVLLIAGFTPIPADPWWRESAMIHRLSPTVKWAAELLPAPIREQLDFEPKLEAPAGPGRTEESQKQGADEQQEETAL
jgi:membrane protein required for colicin V production